THVVAGIAAGQRVVVGAAEQRIKTAAAQQRVVARLTEELVAAGSPGHRVIAGAPEEIRGGKGAVGLVQGEVVAAVETEYRDQRGVGHGGGTTLNRHRTPVDQDRAGGIAADGDAVVLRVAEDRERAS